jgi:predicted aminopeptidase
MFKKIALLFFVVISLLCLYYRDLIGYGWAQAAGQIHILRNVKEVEEVLSDPAFPDSLKAGIRLIEEIKKFGIDSLGLNPSRNYTSFYDQGGRPILWVVTASERYKIQAKAWNFPILGTFSYKGFFDSTLANEEMLSLKKQGWDVERSEVSAWSTLGYLRDPILSSMLSRSEGSLASLILHELTHGTLFVKNNLELNENLASFVGDHGAVRFLRYKYGESSPELERYLLSKKYNDAWSEHMLRGTKRLDSLYETFPGNNGRDEAKDVLKSDLIAVIVADTDTLLNGRYRSKPSKRFRELNNAYFIGYQTYRSRQNIFKEEFETKFASDFKEYFQFLKQKYPSL